ncbi:MAG: hypothetical protein UX98_C0005G0051 [Parcubacteria group bacterium GW2011_GWA2_47_26]|nr:MAG: hypothetical protein UX98_C0005G0051 [Parcubacteria group bacterium GW2011_GWA2_47_26]
MEFICKHDPSDPNHLICESKRSPVFEWLRGRWQQFYCAGPSCPTHKAYTHLVVDIFLVIAVAGLVVANLVFLSRGRGGDKVGSNSPRAQTATLATIRGGEEEVEKSQPNLFSGEENKEESLQYSGQSELFLEGEALYFSMEGEQLGRGPWPLQAGQETKIKVFLRANTGRDFEGVVVSGKLGPNAAWTGFAPQGRGLVYEPASQIVRWRITWSDRPGSSTRAVFEVAITPDFSQIQEGQVLIMEDLKIRAKSLVSGESKTVLAPDVILDMTTGSVLK